MSPVPMCISSAEARLGSPAAQKQLVLVKPSPNVASDDRSEQFAAVVVPATIQPFFVTDLYAKDSGYVSQVNNDIGDHVKRGQVLAVIEDPELQAQFYKAQATVQQTTAALEVAQRRLAGMQADLIPSRISFRRPP